MLNLSTIESPLKWQEDMENLPFKAGSYEAMTAEEAIAEYIKHYYGDEVVTHCYEKEIFYKGEGWEWIPASREEATLCRIFVSSQLRDEQHKKWAIPAWYSSGYNDRT